MTIVKGFYDDIHFTESNLKNFEFVDDTLIVEIDSGLGIYPPHPLASSHTMSDPCKLIFKNVRLSKRHISIYAGDPKIDGFKERKIIIDRDTFLNVDESYEDYSIEGVLLEPKAWISWDILAREFYVDDLKNDEFN